ncbi:MAG TPA: AMP-binding protein, partial [Polyangiaceae bacterium]|nr:AMP-binding protein [Polyangiaceae bacterium]
VAELYTFTHFGAAMAINDSKLNLIGNLAEVKPTILVAVPRVFNRIYDGVNKQMAQKPGAIQRLFRSGIASATKKKRGQHLTLGERAGLALADKLVFGKIRQKFGGRLRFTVSGSAALSTEVAEFVDALGIDVYEGYGMTETSPVVSVNYPGKRKIGTVGPPIPGVSVRIDHEATGDEVNGEILVSGPNVMVGYHNREDENAQILLPDGWIRTGDMGYLDADGFLVITGRIKEQYKLENGKYVVPSPLEEELKLSPHILNIMLYGANKPHNVAVVVLDEASVRHWAKGQGLTLPADPAQSPEVRKLIHGELVRYSSSFKGYERPRDFVLTAEDFTSENGMLTPKMSVKRRNVLARYGLALDALYHS